MQQPTQPSSLLKSAPADVGQGGKRQESGVYTGVNEHFESFSNAERRRPSVFQQTASSTRRAAAMASLAAVLLLAIAACALAPIQEMSDARQALQAAREAGAEKHAPRYWRDAETLLQHAEGALGEGKDGFRTARSDALAAKDAAMKGRSVALAIAAAKSSVAEAVAAGALSDAAEATLQDAVAAARQGDDERAIELADKARRRAEKDIESAPPPP
jgi:hypothetical protein